MKVNKTAYGKSYNCRKANFKFEIALYPAGLYYIIAEHSKLDIRYNSLWQKITFESVDDAVEFIHTFCKNPVCYKVIGDDVKKLFNK